MSATVGAAGVVQIGVCRFVGEPSNFVTLSTAALLAGWPESTLKSKLRALTGDMASYGNGWIVMRDKVGLRQLKKGQCLAPSAPKVALIQLGLLCNMTKETGGVAAMETNKTVIRELYHLANAYDPAAETAVRAMEAQEQRGRHRQGRLSDGGGAGQSTPTPYRYLNTGGGGSEHADEGFEDSDHMQGDGGGQERDSDRGWSLSEEERDMEEERARAGRGQVAGAGHRRMQGQGVNTMRVVNSLLDRGVNVSNSNPSPYIRPTFGPSYRFPDVLPATLLAPTQITERYGFDEASLPRQAKAELRSFEAWSTMGINLSRTERYSRGVQTDTIAKHRDRIRGVLGWVCTYFKVPPKDISLAEYADPDKVSHFIAYLKTRGVGRWAFGLVGSSRVLDLCRGYGVGWVGCL
jgi:hypothetical protein